MRLERRGNWRVWCAARCGGGRYWWAGCHRAAAHQAADARDRLGAQAIDPLPPVGVQPGVEVRRIGAAGTLGMTGRGKLHHLDIQRHA